MKLSMKSEYREHHGKLNMSPGGIACPCCGWGCHPRTAKPLIRRLARRRANAKVKNDLALNQEERHDR